MANEPTDEGAYIEDWNELSKAELIEECKARDLPTNGNKPDLIARLEAAEPIDSNSGEDEPEQTTDSEDPDEPQSDAPEEVLDEPESPEDGSGESPSVAGLTPLPKTTSGQDSVPDGGMYHAEFDLAPDYDILEEDLDLDWKLRARDAALQDGKTPIGGAYAAHHVRFGSRDGKRTIVYAVPIKTG